MKRVIEMNRGKADRVLSCLMLLAVFVAPETFAGEEHMHVNAASQTQQALVRSPRPAKNLNDLINRLKAAGQRVFLHGKVSQPFFSVGGRILIVGGAQVQVFQYANEKAAEREAKAIDPRGSGVGTSMPMWVAPPHFYKSGRLIALYVGQSSKVIRALEGALGPQFAGT